MADRATEELAKIVHRTGCLLLGDFVLTSGLKSPYYIDLSNLYAHSNAYLHVVGALAEEINRETDGEFCVAGIPVRGLPFAVSVANFLRCSLLVLRKKAKRHGTARVLEGRLEMCSSVVLIDDVTTTGRSLSDAAADVSEMDIEVKGAFVVVDRLQGARERLEKQGVPLKSLATIVEITDVLERESLISEEDSTAVREYVLAK